MKYTPNRRDDGILSGDSLGTSSDDGSHDFSTDEDCREKRTRRGNRKGRRRGDKFRSERRGTDVKWMLTPVVKVLLFGVLMSFLDILYIMNHLEGSTEIKIRNISPGVEPLSDSSKASLKNKQNEEQSLSGDSNSISNNKESKTQDSGGGGILGDREPILKLIRDAGIDYDPIKDVEFIEKLPKWSQVVEMYGPEPVIYGLNEGNCERFQAQTDKGDHLIGTAGTFNTGTNLMSELLIANCVMPERVKKHGQKSRGIRWQVPWGKHSPAGNSTFREAHKTLKDKLIDAKDIMPMVTIRDPLIWLKSMCRHKYTARWEGFKEENHCPNFLRKDLNMFVKYDGFNRNYESLLHLWNDWYNEYLSIDVPYLLIRFEDLVFRPQETVTKVCECGGGRVMSKKFRYIVNSAKKGEAAHGAISVRTGFVDAMIKYGSLEKRYKGYDSIEDLKYVRDNIDARLMGLMQYSGIDPQWNEKNPTKDT